MHKIKVQDLCTAITKETGPKKVVALIKELRTLLTDQQAKLEVNSDSARKPWVTVADLQYRRNMGFATNELDIVGGRFV
jgi:hypothetical protein